MGDPAPPRPVSPAVLLAGFLAVAVVLLFGAFLALFEILPGSGSGAAGDHLDALEGVVAATEPPGAVLVSHYRNDVCDSGVNEVGWTLRTGRTLPELQDGYRRKLTALHWKITTTRLAPTDTDAPLEAERRFDWGRAYLHVEPGEHRREIGVTAGFNCNLD